jgi:hypothetical protein
VCTTIQSCKHSEIGFEVLTFCVVAFQKRYSAPVNSKWEMEMKMTGKERREYLTWKQQREEIERERINRHKTQSGEWKREWDVDKTDDYQNTPIQEEPIISHGTPKR